MSEGDTEQCPGCESDAFGGHSNGLLGMFWCPDCEQEYWQEGDGWYSCGETGVPARV